LWCGSRYDGDCPFSLDDLILKRANKRTGPGLSVKGRNGLAQSSDFALMVANQCVGRDHVCTSAPFYLIRGNWATAELESNQGRLANISTLNPREMH
jgi:hypothetical protein